VRSSPYTPHESAKPLPAVLRERYVRDDIPCGFEGCRLCAGFPGYKAALPRSGFRKHSKLNSPNGHYLVIDTNIVLHQVSQLVNSLTLQLTGRQMDLLTALPFDLPLLVPSTTIRETRHRSLPLYNRLQQLVQDEDRKVWVWWNEERRETATIANIADDGAKETINDQNDRGG
jgi:exosome complex exonuclease DIS3/RRP44